MTEEDLFLKSEADSWYKRCADGCSPEVRRGDMVTTLIRRHRLAFKRVLDVGSANGWRLEMLREKSPRASYTGVEPSRIAVRAGKKMFPKIHLLRGVALALPVKGVFDLVLVVSVFHWVSREKLFASVAEIDRVVAEGGYLVVSDFLPRTPLKNKYSHLKRGVTTWKMDYGALFEAVGNYRLVERIIFDYDTIKKANSHTPDSARAVVTVYQKKTGSGYATQL